MTESPVELSMPVSAADFRALMAQFPTGVAIVTSWDDDDRPWGMTCSSMCSVTLYPPTLLICLRVGSPTLAAITTRGTFAVNLLHGKARSAAELFASGLPERFDLVRWSQPAQAGGPHLISDAHVVADCRVSRTERVGDHVVLFGECTQVAEQHDHDPLLYGRRQFSIWQGGQA